MNSAAHSSVIKSSNFEPALRPTAYNPGRYALPSRRPLATTFRKSHTSAPKHNIYIGRISTEVPYHEIIDSRPPLRPDLSTPGPWHYSPQLTKPLNETNAPAFTMRPRCWPEKAKSEGGRTSWSKTWYQTPEVWTTKANFMHETMWPDPSTYEEPLQIGGEHQPRLKRFPAHTFGHREKISFTKPNAEKEPCPSSYSKDKADKIIYKKAPAVIHSFRHKNASFWGAKEVTPGPAFYSPNSGFLKKHQPAFSIGRSPRTPQQPLLGPFAS